MGNSVLGDAVSASRSRASLTNFYTSSAWIEGRAEHQIAQLAGWDGVQKIAAFADLHPGKYGPVGCAVLADRIYPQLVGNDIGCGMSLFQLDLPVRKFKLEKAARRMRVLGEPAQVDHADRLSDPEGVRFAPSLGTIGGGNHFCEVQTLAQCDPELGLDRGVLYLLVHSGSRGFGSAVLGALPEGAFAGMVPDDPAPQAYVKSHDAAVAWASLNRQIIAERAAEALRADLRLISDAPHNLLSAEGGAWLHRKGAAKATGLVPLAGSRASESYLLRPCDHPDALGSTAHGAGRRYDRSSMHGRVRAKRSDIEAMTRNPFGGRVICEDRDVLVEEAPLAYKSARAVVADLAATGAAVPVATFHPLLTFKKTREGRST